LKNGQLKEEELRRLTSPDWPGIFLPSDNPQKTHQWIRPTRCYGFNN